MKKKLSIYPRIKNWICCSFLFLLILGTVPSSLVILSTNKLDGVHDLESRERPLISHKLEKLTRNDPDAYFPNFIFYSVEIANVLVDYLYDNISGGFYTSSDEHWQESRINIEKKTYDNAQAILAFLKLSDASINQTEKEFALNIAEETGNCLIKELYDETYDGFLTSQSNRYKKPGIQAMAIRALLFLYEKTGNLTYRNAAINAFDFLDKFAWDLVDDENGYYYYLLSHTGILALKNPNLYDLYEPESKRVDHNVLMGDALLDLYRLESDEDYLSKALQIYNFFNTTCRNISTGLFYTGLDINNDIVESGLADIFINSLVLQFLAHLYNVTEDLTYYNEFFTLLNNVLLNFWDDNNGGFYATYSYDDPEVRDDKKYTERLFYAIRAIDEAYKLTNDNLYYNLILDVCEFLNNKLYDNSHTGYFQLVNNDGSQGGNPSWNDKYTVTQSLAIYSLANLWLYSKPGVLNALWSPANPRPNDEVTIMVAAFDSDGLSNVLFNYSIDDNPYQIVEMVSHSRVGNIFNTTLDAHSDGTTVRFNIIVNDTYGNKAIREVYSFSWQSDIWAPRILEIGFNPGISIPVHTKFSIIVSAQDVPIQGDVEYMHIFYGLEGKPKESLALERIDLHLWKVTFPDGLPIPGNYIYYFEAIDGRRNFGYSIDHYFFILGHLETFPIEIIIGVLFVLLVIVPAILYFNEEYKKKRARKIIKSRREERFLKRRGKRGKRGVGNKKGLEA